MVEYLFPCILSVSTNENLGRKGAGKILVVISVISDSFGVEVNTSEIITEVATRV